MPATAKRERSGGDGPRPQVAGPTNLQGGQGVVFAGLSEEGEELDQALADNIGISADIPGAASLRSAATKPEALN